MRVMAKVMCGLSSNFNLGYTLLILVNYVSIKEGSGFIFDNFGFSIVMFGFHIILWYVYCLL